MNELLAIEKITANYNIEKELGRGGMGIVYLATDKRLDRPVAIKVLNLASLDEYLGSDLTEIVERFNREAKAIAKLSHPNIVRIYDMGSENNLHYMVMEFLEGKDLSKLKPSEKPDINQTARIGMQICEALDFVHKRGIVHRDIKPANIVLDSGNIAKLMDFGLAQLNQEGQMRLTREGSVMGSIMYSSPEQLVNAKNVDGRADIYSLGVTLYELLAGQLPFDGDNVAVVVMKILKDKPIPPSNLNKKVSPLLDMIILKALEKDAEDRYQNAAEFNKDLSKFLSEEDPSVLTKSEIDKTLLLEREKLEEELKIGKLKLRLEIEQIEKQREELLREGKQKSEDQEFEEELRKQEIEDKQIEKEIRKQRLEQQKLEQDLRKQKEEEYLIRQERQKLELQKFDKELTKQQKEEELKKQEIQRLEQQQLEEEIRKQQIENELKKQEIQRLEQQQLEKEIRKQKIELQQLEKEIKKQKEEEELKRQERQRIEEQQKLEQELRKQKAENELKKQEIQRLEQQKLEQELRKQKAENELKKQELKRLEDQKLEQELRKQKEEDELKKNPAQNVFNFSKPKIVNKETTKDINIDSHKDPVLFDKAKKYIDEEDFDAAIGCLRTLIDMQPKVAKYHSYLGLVLSIKGWDGYAQAEFKIALYHDPSDSVAIEYYKSSQEKAKENSKATNKVSELNPSSVSNNVFFTKLKKLFKG